jgi:hypothetical protein
MSTPAPIACGTPAGRKTTLPAWDGHLVQRAEELLRILGVDPCAVRRRVGVLALADPDDARLLARPEHDPRLGLSELRVEVRAGEGTVGVGVHGQPLRRVEQLHEDARRARRRGGAKPSAGIRRDRVAQEPPVLEPGEPRAGLVAARVLGLGDRPDPVLGEVAVGAVLVPAEAVEEGAAPVEAVDAGLGEPLGPHAG